MRSSYSIHLKTGEAHVWALPLDPSPGHEFAELLLDQEEQTRLARLKHPAVARRFTLAHAGLRLLLSHYSGRPCAIVRYCHGDHGKPELTPLSPIHFNLSHSSDLALIAISLQSVGVDLEYIDSNIPFESMATRYFSSTESRVLNSLPEPLQLQSFYACWTRKEAYLKASGSGFSLPCNCFDVSLAPGEQPALLQHTLDKDQPLHWRIYDLSLPGGFQGSVATTKSTSDIRQYSGVWGNPPLSFHP